MIDEGYIKFRSNWQRSAALDNPEIDELVRWRKPLYAAGLIGHYAEAGIGYGNISMQLPDSTAFVISGTQTGHLPELDSNHFALVSDYDICSNTVTSSGAIEASSESMTHAAIYEVDSHIRAVVHVHSDEMWVGFKGVLPTTKESVAYGTPEMAHEFFRLFHETEFSQKGLAVMAGHNAGLISIGRSMQEATERILSLREEFMT
jgi:hypothetical protein